MLTELQALSAFHKAKEDLLKAIQKYNWTLADFQQFNDEAKTKYQPMYLVYIYTK